MPSLTVTSYASPNLDAGETLNDEDFGYMLVDTLPATGADLDRLVGLVIALMALGSGVAFVGATSQVSNRSRRLGGTA